MSSHIFLSQLFLTSLTSLKYHCSQSHPLVLSSQTSSSKKADASRDLRKLLLDIYELHSAGCEEWHWHSAPASGHTPAPTGAKANSPSQYLYDIAAAFSWPCFFCTDSAWNPIVFVASSSLEAVKIYPPSQQTAVLHIIHSHYHVHVLLLLLSVSDYILHNENCSNVAANILSNLAPDWWKQWMHGQGLPLFNGQSGPGNLMLLYKIKCPQKDSLPQISFSETYVYCSKFNKNERKLYVICRAVTISTMLSWSILTLELLSLTCCYGQWQC